MFFSTEPDSDDDDNKDLSSVWVSDNTISLQFVHIYKVANSYDHMMSGLRLRFTSYELANS